MLQEHKDRALDIVKELKHFFLLIMIIDGF